MRNPRFFLLVVLALFLFGLPAGAQQTPAQKEPLPVLKKETSLVLVDAVVTDKKGKAVRDLQREDFEIKEDGKRQPIDIFSLGGESATRATPPPLPPNVFTNRPEYHPPREPLTIVLLDSLNTPRVDQARMREEMLHYLASALKSDQWTAILALTSQLRVLQGFTTDRELLLAAAKKFTPQQSSQLGLREHMSSRETRDEIEVLRQEPGGQMIKDLIELLQRLEEDATIASDMERAKLTLAALRGLSNAVAGYPGRKNLIWVSGSFPVFFRPTMRGGNFTSAGDELQQTVRLLNDARVAVYPVDPRGLLSAIEPETYAEHASRVAESIQLNAPQASQSSVRNPLYYLRVSQDSLNLLAANTGGQAFYNRNDIEHAVALAVADGSSYYTLGYYPDNKDWDGKFRNIELKLARKGLHLRYRKGYYATRTPPHDAPDTGSSGQINSELQAALSDPFPATGIVFRAKVPPPEPAASAQVRVEFWLDKDSFPVQGWAEGARQISMDYVVAAFSAEGKTVTNVAKRLAWALQPNDYAQILQRGLVLPAVIELAPGQYELRLLLRDRGTGLLGRIDVPLTLPSPPATAPQ